jgi:hypothetical protein
MEFIKSITHDTVFGKLKSAIDIIQQNNLTVKLCSPNSVNAEDGKLSELKPAAGP